MFLRVLAGLVFCLSTTAAHADVAPPDYCALNLVKSYVCDSASGSRHAPVQLADTAKQVCLSERDRAHQSCLTQSNFTRDQCEKQYQYRTERCNSMQPPKTGRGVN